VSAVRVYTVTCHAAGHHDLASARCLDQRMTLAQTLLESVGDEERALMAFPAGFLRVSTIALRDQVAERLFALARESGVAALFGVDVQAQAGWRAFPDPALVFAYACDGGRRLTWPTALVRGSRDDARLPADRTLKLEGIAIGLLLDSELFSPRLRAQLGRPDLALVLSHGGATVRWRDALGALDRRCPAVVVGQQIEGRRQLDLVPPRGFHRSVTAATGEATVHCYTSSVAAEEAVGRQ
jgi:hypothetical protein